MPGQLATSSNIVDMWRDGLRVTLGTKQFRAHVANFLRKFRRRRASRRHVDLHCLNLQRRFADGV